MSTYPKLYHDKMNLVWEENDKISSYLRWLPVEVMEDVLDIGQFCRIGEEVYQGAWATISSGINARRHIFFFSSPVPIQKLKDHVNWFDAQKKEGMVECIISDVRGRYQGLTDTETDPEWNLWNWTR
jgi:hypothetical protein